MENAFKSIQSGAADEAGKAQATDFAERVTTGDPLSGFSDEEVLESAKILKDLSPEQLQRALGASMKNINSNITTDQRSSLNTMLKERQAGQGLVDITRSGEAVPASGSSGSGGADLDDVLGGLLGGGAGSGGLEDILGGLLGGGGGASQQAPASGGGGGLGGMLGGLLGGLMGGGGGGGASSGSNALDDMLGQIMGGGDQAAAPAKDSGGGIGGLLSGPLGKAVIAGAAGYAMKEILGK